MYWNQDLLKKNGFNKDWINNRKRLFKLVSLDKLGVLINLKIKLKTADEHWLDTFIKGKELLLDISITDRDQYYDKILRIVRYTIFNKIVKTKYVKRSPNKQLRYDYKEGGVDNIISRYAENITLKSGYWVPPHFDYLPKQIMNENNKKIKKYMTTSRD